MVLTRRQAGLARSGLAAAPADEAEDRTDGESRGGRGLTRSKGSRGSLQALQDGLRLVRTESSKELARHLSGSVHDEDFGLRFSLTVALSSLCYGMVAAMHYVRGSERQAALFAVITLFSLLADSVLAHSTVMGVLDRITATTGTLVSPARIIFMPGQASTEVRVSTLAITVFSLSFLLWSRRSRSMEQYVFRHSMWHLVSSLGLTWLADLDGRGALMGSAWGPLFKAVAVAVAAAR